MLRRFYVILTFTALIGWLPIGICLIAVEFALANGAREWADLTFNVVFIGMYLALTGLGAYIHTHFN